MNRKSLYFPLLSAVFFVFCFIVFKKNSDFLLVEAQDIKIVNQPATGGRQITPAGKLLFDATTSQPAVGALPVDFVRSPDTSGFDGKGRYLLTINSGFGLQFNASTNRAQQSIAVIDLNEKPAPQIIQNVYFPSPQSVNVGAVFAHKANADGSYNLFVSGGYENKIWIFKFRAGDKTPVTPTSNGFDTKVDAPFINVSAFADNAPMPNYNSNIAAVYPTGIALSPDDNTLFVANNLGDTLGIISDLRDRRKISRISLIREGSEQFVYPYQVAVLPSKDNKTAEKIYVSLWGDGTIAVVDAKNPAKVMKHIAVNRHPTAMIFNRAKSRLYVVNSNADVVSVDTAIVVVEDDAQDGSDHVDAHRSVALVISAYNRKGVLIHDFHNTVSLIRTMEILLGIPPMNQLDATASPIDTSQSEPDLTPFQAILPDVALDNLMPLHNTNAEMHKYMKLTDKQNLAHAYMANPRELNEIIWFSVRGNIAEMPGIARLPAFDLMTAGIVKENDDEEREEQNEEIETRAKVIKNLAKTRNKIRQIKTFFLSHRFSQINTRYF